MPLHPKKGNPFKRLLTCLLLAAVAAGFWMVFRIFVDTPQVETTAAVSDLPGHHAAAVAAPVSSFDSIQTTGQGPFAVRLSL